MFNRLFATPLKKVSALIVSVLFIYASSIAWRVSTAELKYFGRSDLIPLSLDPPKEHGKKIAQSFGSRTYIFNRNGEKIYVWKQKINGFQHVYGSALMALELGEKASDVAFCGNEFVEALFDHDQLTYRDLRDRRKDLYHNRLGRAIGLNSKQLGLSGKEAEDYISQVILNKMRSGNQIIEHFKDPRIDTLPTETALNCPNLPKRSILDVILGTKTQSQKLHN